MMSKTSCPVIVTHSTAPFGIYLKIPSKSLSFLFDDVGIGTLTTGVVDYRVEQYKLEIERKEAKDNSDEKRANT